MSTNQLQLSFLIFNFSKSIHECNISFISAHKFHLFLRNNFWVKNKLLSFRRKVLSWMISINLRSTTDKTLKFVDHDIWQKYRLRLCIPGSIHSSFCTSTFSYIWWIKMTKTFYQQIHTFFYLKNNSSYEKW